MMNRVISRVRITLLLILILTGGMALFLGEYFAKGEDWILFPGSPHVYNGNAVETGLITDRTDALLLDLSEGRVYSQSEAIRKALVHWTGDREGNVASPILSNYTEKLIAYDPVNGIYQYGAATTQVKLTLSARVQMAALEAMGDYKGTVAVYNYQTGEILCALSTPTFDPDVLPEAAQDGMYLNRFIQSTYTPGSIFKIVTTAAALESIPDIQQQTFTCSGSISYGVDQVTCEQSHGTLMLKEAFARSCNCAFAQIADQLGGELLESYAEQFGITDQLTFDGFSTRAGSVTAEGEAPVQVAWSAIGQHKDLINPCSYLTFVGAVASGGNGIKPYVVSGITVGSSATYSASKAETGRIMSTETAQTLISFLRNNVENYYGDDSFPGLTVCAKSGTAEVGGTQKPNAMFAGFVADPEYPLAFIAAIEDGGYGRQICVPVLRQILDACKAEMDRFHG